MLLPSCLACVVVRPKVGEAAPGGLPNQVAISTAEAEAAEGLCTWTVATLCRALTLPNILTLLTGRVCARGSGCSAPCAAQCAACSDRPSRAVHVCMHQSNGIAANFHESCHATGKLNPV